jgi:hypothetical protein
MGFGDNKGGVVSNLIEQSSKRTLSVAAAFRVRMESQCRQIRLYRLAMLRDRGRALTLDEAALEWIAQFAATFDSNQPAE